MFRSEVEPMVQTEPSSEPAELRLSAAGLTAAAEAAPVTLLSPEFTMRCLVETILL